MKQLKIQPTFTLALCALFSFTTVSCENKDVDMGPAGPGMANGATPPNLSWSNDPKPEMEPQGFSTWTGEVPPIDVLATNLTAVIQLNYFSSATPVEGVLDGRAQGVSYFINFTDGLGRYRYRSREECPFKDFHVFKPVTYGSSTGPIGISSAGVAELGVVLSNPSNLRLGEITDADAPPTATGVCRAPNLKTNYEYDGLVMVHHVTIGVRIARTPERCATYCRAKGDATPACSATCAAAPAPFTAQTSFELDSQFQVVSRDTSAGTLIFDAGNNNLDAEVTLNLN